MSFFKRFDSNAIHPTFVITGICAAAPMLAATWTQHEELTALNTRLFGASVAMSGISRSSASLP